MSDDDGPPRRGERSGELGGAGRQDAVGRAAVPAAVPEPPASAGEPAGAPPAPPAAELAASAAVPAARGPQLARAALEAARATGRSHSAKTRDPGSGQSLRRRRWSGAGADPRDPQLLGGLVRRMVRDRGWEKTAADARVLGDWPALVGADIAAKCAPVGLRDGELTLQAESTAWATQLRLLAPRLLATLAGELGAGVVKRIHVHGPSGPSWKRGRLAVRGRGPRDTYG